METNSTIFPKCSTITKTEALEENYKKWYLHCKYIFLFGSDARLTCVEFLLSSRKAGTYTLICGYMQLLINTYMESAFVIHK